MPAGQHKYSIEELLGAFLRDHGIREGYWPLNVEFSATDAAVKPLDAFPSHWNDVTQSACIRISKNRDVVMLQRNMYKSPAAKHHRQKLLLCTGF